MTRGVGAGCLLGLTLALAACSSDVRIIRDQAEARWREGNYDDAIRLNTLLYERDHQGKYAAQALLNIGNIYYLNLRQLRNAIDTYKRLVEEMPGRPEEIRARRQLASIYANEIGDLTQAITQYEKILESEDLPDRQEVELLRADAYLKKDERDRALRELRRIEESGISGHFADQVYLKIGNIYQMQNKTDDATAYFSRVTASPCIECRRRALLHLMETYEAVYDYDRAIATVKRLDPSPENDQRIAREVRRLNDKRARVESGVVLNWEHKRSRR